MHLILTGATGLVGTACLYRLVAIDRITKISVLSRRPVQLPKDTQKVNVIIHNDFTQYESVLDQLKGAEGCIWALGPSVNAVSKSDYIRMTSDFPVAAAQAFSTLSDKFNFVYVSGFSSTRTPTRFTPFNARIKGSAEAELEKLSSSHPSLRMYFPRPGYIDPTGYPEIEAFIPPRGAVQRFGDVIGTLMGIVSKNTHSPVKELSSVLVELAMADGEPLSGPGIENGRIISPQGIWRLSEDNLASFSG